MARILQMDADFIQCFRVLQLCPLQVLQEPLQLPVSPLAVLLRVQGGRGERELFPPRVATGQPVRGDTGRQDRTGNFLRAKRKDACTGAAEGELEGGTFEGHPPGTEAVEVHGIAVAVLLPKDGTDVMLQQLDETGAGLHDEQGQNFLPKAMFMNVIINILKSNSQERCSR